MLHTFYEWRSIRYSRSYLTLQIAIEKMENTLITDSRNKHILLILDQTDEWKQKATPYQKEQVEYLRKHFCGVVYDSVQDSVMTCFFMHNVTLLFCGDFGSFSGKEHTDGLMCIKDLVINCNHIEYFQPGKVPINMHGCGVYFRNYFDEEYQEKFDFTENIYFDAVKSVHNFLELTESNKPHSAFRKGIYLTKVRKDSKGIRFNLLRCSTNMKGPSEIFKNIDDAIVNEVNYIASLFFEKRVSMNHVLAQIYENGIVNDKEKKAKIKEHSDKTKDMPRSGLIAFCTFYKDLKGKRKSFDVTYKDASVLTKLRFRLKDPLNHPELEKKFDVVLYPNSVFIIPLSTNRLYTHEIIPSSLPLDKLPTRMGYVIRCSNTIAIHKDGKTFVENTHGNLKELEEPSDDGVKRLKELYMRENKEDSMIEYDKDNLCFSLNKGDYLQPLFEGYEV
jgi:hypothetical protein